MPGKSKIAGYLMCAGCLLCLLQIWLPGWFLTGDGPCHVYNAGILHDLWIGKNTAFYSRFFEVSNHPDPNWLATVVIAALIFVVKGVVAEKIFITIYVAAFIAGSYLLLKKITGNSPFWLLAIFIFVFTHALSKGFYNFSFSIAFYFWVVWAWLRFLERKTVGRGAVFLLFVALAFFTHLLPFALSVFTCAMLVLSYTIAYARGSVRQRFTGYLLPYAGLLCLLVAPFMLLMFAFMQNQGGLQLHLALQAYRVKELWMFHYIVNMEQKESLFVAISGTTLLLLLAYAGFVYLKQRKIHKYDGFIASLMLLGFVYCFFPEAFLGRTILITMRVQPLVYLLIAICVAYMLPDARIKNMAGLIIFGCFVALVFIRIACLQRAADAVRDYTSVEKYINPYTIILPLDFSPGGLDGQGNAITDANWLFCHAGQYMGLQKPLIFLDNYEANTGYFPLVWKDAVNPYHHLCTNGAIEAQPPFATIQDYKRTTGVQIDYILMWCYNPSWLADAKFSKLYAEINENYKVIYTSPSDRTILYGRRQ